MTPRQPPTEHASGRLEVLPALDGMRAVAAGMVVLTHAAFLTGVGSQGLLGHLLSRGDYGVAIFFALSGFLLHRGLTAELLSRGRVDTLGYALRRVARIVPAYWLALIVVVLFANPDLRLWVLTGLGLQIYVADMAIPAFGQSWSIATEASFYVALPFVVAVIGRARRRAPTLPLILLVTAMAVTTLLPLVTGPAAYGENLLVERWLPWRAPHFLVGMICAEALLHPSHPVSHALHRIARDPVGCLLVAGAAYLASTTPVAGSLTLDPAHGATLLMRTTLATVVAAGLLLPVTLAPPSSWSRLLASPLLRWLGHVSFGLFLWHLPVFTALYAVTGAPFFRGGILPLLATGLPLSLLLAAVSHHALELPVSRRVARGLAHRREMGSRRGQGHSKDQRQPYAPLDGRTPD